MSQLHEVRDPTSLDNGDALPSVPGNSAKLYCLGRVDALAARQDLTILDLGCGSGCQVVPLLLKRPKLRYIGVEPHRRIGKDAADALAPFHAEVFDVPADDVDLAADVVLSFSVIEHVYRRDRYIASIARNLREDELAFVNYDAGHFTEEKGGLLKSLTRRLLARAGREGYYQAFVRDDDLRNLIARFPLRIIDEKMFNSRLKDFYKFVPEARGEDFMRRWLDFELYLNELGIEYQDELAPVFRTRNFVLKKI